MVLCMYSQISIKVCVGKVMHKTEMRTYKKITKFNQERATLRRKIYNSSSTLNRFYRDITNLK